MCFTILSIELLQGLHCVSKPSTSMTFPFPFWNEKGGHVSSPWVHWMPPFLHSPSMAWASPLQLPSQKRTEEKVSDDTGQERANLHAYVSS